MRRREYLPRTLTPWRLQIQSWRMRHLAGAALEAPEAARASGWHTSRTSKWPCPSNQPMVDEDSIPPNRRQASRPDTAGRGHLNLCVFVGGTSARKTPPLDRIGDGWTGWRLGHGDLGVGEISENLPSVCVKTRPVLHGPFFAGRRAAADRLRANGLGSATALTSVSCSRGPMC